MHCEGFIYDSSLHYLDHLAPFCSLMGWKLALSDPLLIEKALRFYPALEVYKKEREDLFSYPLVTCEPRRLIRAVLSNPQLPTIWLPHGNSDKGWRSPFFEALQPGEPAFVYGQKMLDFFREKGVNPQPISVGNFRSAYFEQHRDFYRRKLEELNIPKAQRNFLYAPTWEDAENNGSFWQAFPLLAEYVPDQVNLLVKWHPNTYSRFADKIEILMGQYQKRTNIIFIEDFPPIYPLLSLVDAYIGDMSSIGYDFLFFNRPLFFLNVQNRNPLIDKGLYLYRCGIEIPLTEIRSLFSLSDDGQLAAVRQRTYRYTFAPVFNPATIRAACALLL